ncbi:MAG: hypothetical protein QM270_05510 [Bacillota bacterium]|nr:hypothetical protein [Bacillota bacterium]
MQFFKVPHRKAAEAWNFARNGPEMCSISRFRTGKLRKLEFLHEMARKCAVFQGSAPESCGSLKFRTKWPGNVQFFKVPHRKAAEASDFAHLSFRVSLQQLFMIMFTPAV